MKYVNNNANCTRIDAPVVIDASLQNEAWGGVAAIGDFRQYGTDLDMPDRTAVQTCYDHANLYVRCTCYDADIDSRKYAPRSPSPFLHLAGDRIGQDFVRIALDPRHDHLNYYALTVNIDGASTILRGKCLGGEQRWDLYEQREDCAEGSAGATFEEKGVQYSIQTHAGCWIIDLALPLSEFELTPDTTPVCGLSLLRGKSSRRTTYSLWQTGNYYTNNYSMQPVPQEFGDLYFGPVNAVVEELDFGNPVWGDNSLSLRVANPESSDCNVTLAVEVLYEPLDCFFSNASDVCLKAESSGWLSIDYRLSFKKKWSLDLGERQKLLIQIMDRQSEQVMYRAEFSVCYFSGLIAREQYGLESPNPRPDDECFLEKKRAFILGRIPMFSRLNTSAGAESDFVLRSEDGCVSFNLMKSGVMDRIAAFILERFDSDVDRLLGATMFLHQNAVMTHSRSLNGTGIMNPLSMLRVGGSACGNRSVLLIDLVQRLQSDQFPDGFKVFYLTLTGHTVAAVLLDYGYVMLDADNGLFYYALDNSRLASLEEMAADPRIAKRTFHDDRYVADKFGSTDKQTIWESVPASGVFPAGAPAE